MLLLAGSSPLVGAELMWSDEPSSSVFELGVAPRWLIRPISEDEAVWKFWAELESSCRGMAGRGVDRVRNSGWIVRDSDSDLYDLSLSLKLRPLFHGDHCLI